MPKYNNAMLNNEISKITVIICTKVIVFITETAMNNMI